MSSANISFDTIPASIRKPGVYAEFNTRLAVRTLPANLQPMLIVGQRIAAGTQAAGAPVGIFTDRQAADLFGRGSILHLMCRAAIQANAYLQLTAIAVDDAGGGVAAAGTVTPSGPATASGVLSVNIGNQRVDIAYAAADSANTIAAALNAQIAKQPDLPVTAGVAGAIVTLTAKNKGTLGNEIKVSAAFTLGTGVGCVVVAMSTGATDPDITATLAAMFSAGHKIIATAINTQASLLVLRTHLDAVSSAIEKRGAMGFFGFTGTLANGTTLAGQINAGRITGALLPSTTSLSYELAAAYASIAAFEEDPARPLNTLQLAGIAVAPDREPPVAHRAGERA